MITHFVWFSVIYIYIYIYIWTGLPPYAPVHRRISADRQSISRWINTPEQGHVTTREVDHTQLPDDCVTTWNSEYQQTPLFNIYISVQKENPNFESLLRVNYTHTYSHIFKIYREFCLFRVYNFNSCSNDRVFLAIFGIIHECMNSFEKQSDIQIYTWYQID